MSMFSNAEVRQWYVEHTKRIPDMIDFAKPLEEQARQAFDLRNKFKMQARLMMADRESAEMLAIKESIKTFEELLSQKMEDKGLSREEAYLDMLRSAGVTRKSVNDKYGLDGLE